MDHHYSVRATAPAETLSMHIESRRDGELAFDATLNLRRRPARWSALVASALRTLPLIYAHGVALEAQGRPAPPSPPHGGLLMIERVARRLVVALLERIESGQLTLVEGRSRRVFGSGSPQATVVVHDPAVFAALARGGKGLAETYVDGLWDSPDVTAVIEVAARNLDGIDRIRRAMTPVREPWQRGRSFLVRNTPLRAREDIAAHYDLGNDLFELMLDETMMYSAAIFERRETSLAEASRAKLDRICDKLDLGPGDHVLEIGTGWGGFALHAAVDARVPRDDDHVVARAARIGAGAGARGRAWRTASRSCSTTTAS